MATPFTETVDRVVAQFQEAFEKTAVVRRDERPQRAILEMTGSYGVFRIHLREVWRANGSRKYAYYVLQQSRVVVGFDNAADPRALYLKYGSNFSDHHSELVPHRHTADKQAVELTNELDVTACISWLEHNLSDPSQ